MNVYDAAYELKRALMDSEELKTYKRCIEKIKSNPSNKKMLDDFRRKQIELQTMELSGKEPDKEKIEQFQSLYSIISLNSDISEFLQNEGRFGVLVNDISKIIFGAIEQDLSISQNEKNAL